MLRKLVSRGLGALCAAAAVGIFAAAAHATPVVLVDGNSSATFDPTSQAGNSSWVVDGVNHMTQSWFWGTSSAGAPDSLDTAATSPTVFSSGGVLSATYLGDGYNIALKVTLTGGSAGSGNSAMTETFTFNNTSDASMNLRLYEYEDFGLNGTAGGETLNLSGTPKVNTADLTKGTTTAEVVASGGGRAPDRYQTGTGSTIKSLLNGGSPVTFSNNSTGPVIGDDNFAFEWDQTLAAGGTFQISIDKTIQGGSTVPLPNAAYGALALMALLGGVGLVRKAAKRIA